MKANPTRLWIIVLALGWLLDFLFWKKAPGVNFPLFAALCMIGGLYLLMSDGLRPARRSLLLLPIFGFFALVTIVRAEPLTSVLAYGATPFAMSILALTYVGGRWMEYAIPDYAGRYLGLLGSLIARPLSFSADARVARTESGSSAARRSLWPVVRGILIALPVVAVFATLLASADVIFGKRLDAVMDLLKLEQLPEYIFRLAYILAIGYALAGAILHAASESGDAKLAEEGRPIIPPFLGPIESSIVLGSVVTLFAAFVVIQFQYFFGGETNIDVEGYTYSEYTRRGFGELVTVAVFSLLMLLALGAATRRETTSQRGTFSGLGVALVLFVLIMLVSAYQRLVLYEGAYGFSRLRAYTHVFLVWIGLLLIATIVLELLRRERAFALAAIMAGLGFAASLALLNVDAFIVVRNVAREFTEQQPSHPDARAEDALDASYFLELSDDAIPALVTAYRTSAAPAATKDKLGAVLTCIDYRRQQDRVGRGGFLWQSFHFARLSADRALADVRSELGAYQFRDEDLPAIVTTPAGEDFECWQYYYD